MITFRQWLTQATGRLAASESPRRDAEILLGHVTGKSRTTIIAFDETPLTDEQLLSLQQLLERRQHGEPVAYLTGEREFWSLSLRVSSVTLIPRPDSECLVEQALARLPATPCHILDLGTGSGAIALALAHERPDCQVTAVDFLAGAVALAQDNARRLAITNLTIRQSDWFSALAGEQFAMIVSNPPYIDAADPHLAQGDVRFEPKTALVAADKGLADLAHIIREGRSFLLPNGLMLLEHGWQQGEAVWALFHAAGYVDVTTCRDYGHNERLTVAKYAGGERGE